MARRGVCGDFPNDSPPRRRFKLAEASRTLPAQRERERKAPLTI